MRMRHTETANAMRVGGGVRGRSGARTPSQPLSSPRLTLGRGLLGALGRRVGRRIRGGRALHRCSGLGDGRRG